jgi:hypothetical protein
MPLYLPRSTETYYYYYYYYYYYIYYFSTALCWALSAIFTFLILFMVGRTTWTGDQSVARPLPIHRATQTQNKRTQTSMPQVGFELTISVFERAKTVHVLDSAATVIYCRFVNSLLSLPCTCNHPVFPFR